MSLHFLQAGSTIPLCYLYYFNVQFYEQVYEQYFCFLNEMSISPSLWAWERDEELPGSEVQSDELCTKSKRWVHCLLTAPLHCHLLKHSQSVRSLILLTLHQTTLSNHYFFAWQYQIQLKLSFSWSTLENVVDFLLGEKRLKTGKTVCHTNSFNFLIIWDWKQAVWRESATKPLPIIKSCLCARGNACQNRKKKCDYRVSPLLNKPCCGNTSTIPCA